jgi:very-long-chain enoyl-CoA reductase
MSLSPRLHNVVSYGVAFFVMPAAAFANDRSSSWLPIAMWCFHFARRTAEAAWVHRYSKKRLPWTDILFEYVYYWAFAMWIGATLPAVIITSPLVFVGGFLFVFAEFGNAASHWILRSLRSGDSRGRAIPRGFLFEYVSCPHYLCEILTWVAFFCVVPTLAAGAFLVMGAGILTVWATQRHRTYRRDFDYPRERRALIPFLY